MSWQFFPARQHFRQHAQRWDRLNTQLYADHPLFDSRFIAQLIQHFASDQLVLAHHDVEGAEALLLLEQTGSHNWRLFLPSQAQIAPMLLSGDVQAYLPGLFASLPGQPWRLEWLCQDERYMPPLPASVCLVHYPHAQTMAITLDHDFAHYWASRSKNMRHNIARYLRRAEQTHPLRFSVHEAPGAIATAMTEYGLLESRGWKAKIGTSIHPANDQGRFYADLLQAYAQRGQARIYTLHLGETLAASRLCIGNESMLIILKTTYDEDLAEFAPGRLLLYKLLNHEFAQKRYPRIEFYTNATRDQLQWATEQRTILHINHYRTQSHRLGFGILRHFKRWLP